ncbi:MAG: endonuclease/exonuclease/phosphatase family protein [Gammaproteobacteria bacterium]
MSTPFKVMTWNVENLFSPGGSSGPGTQAAFEQKIETLAGVIDALAPDVLALQEVGDEAAFEALNNAVDASYAHGALSSHPDGRGIRVGFLSRLPFKRTEDIFEFPGGALNMVPALDNRARPTALHHMGRGALLVEVKPCRGLTLNLITTHLKSKLITYPRPGGRSSFSPNDEDERARGAG